MNLNPNPTDDLDAIDLDEFEDFDSDDFSPTFRSGNGYLNDMWSNAGYGLASQSDRLTKAHGMVQSFVNAFARDRRYAVRFDESVSTAGTDMKAHNVVITPAPVLDDQLSAEEAGVILIGLATHEISHPRYGKGTANAVRKAFPRSGVAAHVSNVLDDVRIERRFVADYPGYSDVFEPVLQYVGKAFLRDGQPAPLARTDQMNICTGALRYPTFVKWDGIEDERAWWTAWGDRWSREDSPRRHVEAVREALRHIAAVKAAQTKGPANDTADRDDQQGNDEETAAQGEQGAASDEADAADDTTAAGEPEADEEPLKADSAGTSAAADDDAGEDEISDEDLGAEADAADTSEIDMPDCSGSEAVDRGAESAGVNHWDLERAKDDAQEVLEAAERMEDSLDGSKVDVSRSTKGLIHGDVDYRKAHLVERSDTAARAIRDALLRSRTGHTGTTRYQKRGRIDNRGLYRIAQGDARLFSQKHSASPDKFLVWMLVDRSISMNGRDIMDAAAVSIAVAEATRSVPTVRMAVWGWTTPFRGRGNTTAAAGVAKVWETGQATTEIAKLVDLSAGNTPDATVLGWAAPAILRAAKSGERPVIILASDGEGQYHLGRMAEKARSMGIIVRSVAFGSLDAAKQEERFGKDGYIPWAGSIVATAKPLARMIARLVGRDRR